MTLVVDNSFEISNISFTPRDLISYIDEQSFIINGAKNRNLEIWNRNLVNDELVMKQWLSERVIHTNGFINSL